MPKGREAYFDDDGKLWFPDGTNQSSAATGGSYQHEVGFVLLTSNPANPATYYGYGTWTQRSKGRVIIGLDDTDPDYDAVGDVAGSKTHTHDDHPALTHSGTEVDSHTTTNKKAGTSGSAYTQLTGPTGHSVTQPSDHPAQSHSEVSHVMAGWVCYVWERTA